MRKHTPGPWYYQEQSDAYTHIVRCDDTTFLCQLHQDSSGESEANARLIAAAPDLLAALKAICAQKSESNVMENYTPLQNYKVWHAVETAMAKAEGRDPDYSDLGDPDELLANHNSAMEIRRERGDWVAADRDHWMCQGSCNRRLDPIEVTFDETCVHCGGRAG